MVTAPDRRRFNASLVTEDLLHSDSLAETLKWIVPLETLELNRSVLVEELVDGEEATSDLDLDLSALNLDHDATRSKLVDALGLAHEHDLQLLTVGVVVDVLCKFSVDRVLLDWDVDGDAGLEVDDVSA